MFRTLFYLKAASAREEDSIDTVHLSNDSQDNKLSNGVSFTAIVFLGVLENIFEICPFKRTNLNSVGLGGLTVVVLSSSSRTIAFRNVVWLKMVPPDIRPCSLHLGKIILPGNL